MSEPLTIQRLEAATLTAWPAITTAMDGTWLARLARGYTKRSNSIQCLDPADDSDAAARLERLADLYPLNSLDPIFRVTPLAGPGVIAALDADGWEPFEESRVLAMPLAGEFEEAGPVKVYDNTDQAWIDIFGELSGASRRSLEILAQLVGLIACRHAGVLALDATGEPVAAALAVNASGIGVYLNVVTRTDRRGKGFGRTAMQAALNWTRQVGATHAAIQVLSDNAPAINLYSSLGFEEAYRYHYRQPR
ncbi:MAG TPA: GNAT family N-acetyltransferase [Devosiaceae bacterium]|nr:GNAT family N-acetyltransferase [Devosiaceae bacterium]